jgi:hypothetical protein
MIPDLRPDQVSRHERRPDISPVILKDDPGVQPGLALTFDLAHMSPMTMCPARIASSPLYEALMHWQLQPMLPFGWDYACLFEGGHNKYRSSDYPGIPVSNTPLDTCTGGLWLSPRSFAMPTTYRRIIICTA